LFQLRLAHRASAKDDANPLSQKKKLRTFSIDTL